jgi:hypothetical protein
MSKIFAFLNKHSAAVCLVTIAASVFLMPSDLLAQAVQGQQFTTTTGTGPFAAFLARGAKLFSYSRNALFVCAAFAFIIYAWEAIQGNDIPWKKLLFLIVALVLLGVAGYIVSYLANPNDAGQLQTDYRDLGDIGGWQ